MPIFFERFGLECGRIEIIRRRQQMIFEVDQRGGDVFDGGKTLAERPRRDQPAQQMFRHRFAGPIMSGKATQHLGLLEPVLVELGRQFDEIGSDAGA